MSLVTLVWSLMKSVAYSVQKPLMPSITFATAAVGIMASNLPHEFRKFMRSSQLLSRILAETNRSLKEIDEAGFFQGGELKLLELDVCEYFLE